jgi:hypothetical protein
MATEMMEVSVPRIRWGAVIPGIFCAVAMQIVLGLFGAAFGLGGESAGAAGLKVLSGIWEILTPFVALFVGSALAVSLGVRRNVFLNGFVLWCVSLAAVAFYLARDLGTVTGRAEAIGLTGAAIPALAGLSALLGLTGALVGSAVGKRLARYEFARKLEGREEEELEHPEAPVHH